MNDKETQIAREVMSGLPAEYDEFSTLVFAREFLRQVRLHDRLAVGEAVAVLKNYNEHEVASHILHLAA